MRNNPSVLIGCLTGLDWTPLCASAWVFDFECRHAKNARTHFLMLGRHTLSHSLSLSLSRALHFCLGFCLVLLVLLLLFFFSLIQRCGCAAANAKKEAVPTVFRWHRGGRNVYVTGTFNGWKGRIPLNKSHDEFTTIVELPPGTHQYKFIVDDEWMFNPDQPTVPDPYGAMNNMVDVLPPDSLYEIESDESLLSSSPPGTYGQDMPPMEYGAKPPPVLPPHLLQVILNTDPVSEDDPTRLPIPNHVMLNHLYALSIKDGVMVLGVTHRFRKKYITTVLYRCV